MNNELEIMRITEKVLKDQNLWNLPEIFRKEHNIFRGTHKGISAELSWDKISGKPSTFPPSSHTHPGTDITSIVAESAKLIASGFALDTLIANNRVPDSAKLTASGFSLSSLIANNKVPDSDKLEGYHGTDLSTANTYARRNASGDINARLFRSEYDTYNPTCNYIMTQIDTVSNNYIRPSTKAQLIASLNLMTKAGGTFTGYVYARDHGSAATDMIVNVFYGTGNPPTASGTTIGTLFVKYTA